MRFCGEIQQYGADFWRYRIFGSFRCDNLLCRIPDGEEVLNWSEHHHLHIGFFIGIAGAGWTAVQMAMHSGGGITYSLLVTIAGFCYALDDAFWHFYGWKTPFHRLECFLKKFWFWQRFSDWLDKYLFKKGGENVYKP